MLLKPVAQEPLHQALLQELEANRNHMSKYQKTYKDFNYNLWNEANTRLMLVLVGIAILLALWIAGISDNQILIK